MSWFKDIIKNKKKTLAKHSEGILTALAKSCVYAWDDTVELDKILQDSLSMLPHCNLIYTIDTAGELVSSNIEAYTKDATLKGRILVGRPFMENLPYNGFTMSPVYVSLHSRKSCITVMQSVTDGDKVLGFIAADFDVEKLPVDKALKKEETKWQQYKGDPAIRGTLFLQERVQSAMDKQLDNVTEIIKEMMQHHGIFHCKIHYSSSRVSFWTMENPYDYHIHMLDDLINPERCLAYSRQKYPKIATVPVEKIEEVMNMLKILRNMDETVYLRSASFNIVNGIVGLTFSCDGSHYMNYSEFLEWDLDKWIGSKTEKK
jgi:hypothetical protein